MAGLCYFGIIEMSFIQKRKQEKACNYKENKLIEDWNFDYLPLGCNLDLILLEKQYWNPERVTLFQFKVYSQQQNHKNNGVHDFEPMWFLLKSVVLVLPVSIST